MPTTDDGREVELYVRIENTSASDKELKRWASELCIEITDELQGGEIVSAYGVREVSNAANREGVEVPKDTSSASRA